MNTRLINQIITAFVAVILVVLYAEAQELTTLQGTTSDPNRASQQSPSATQTVLTVYEKWRSNTLLNYPLGLLTTHYAVAIVAQRLDNNTAQVEMLIAAEMKHYAITIKPVTLTRQPSGETTTTLAGKAVTIDQKAGEKLGTGADKIRIGQTTTLVPVSRTVQALEITWSPKNDKSDDPSNTCIVQLGKEPAVVVNGYIVGAPVR